VLSDFGLSQYQEHKKLVYIQSPWYRAPEIHAHQKEYNARVDLWSLGMILWEWACGEPLCTLKEDRQAFGVARLFGYQFPEETLGNKETLRRIGELPPLTNEQIRKKVLERVKSSSYGPSFLQLLGKEQSHYLDLIVQSLHYKASLRVPPATLLQSPFFKGMPSALTPSQKVNPLSEDLLVNQHLVRELRENVVFKDHLALRVLVLFNKCYSLRKEAPRLVLIVLLDMLLKLEECSFLALDSFKDYLGNVNRSQLLKLQCQILKALQFRLLDPLPKENPFTVKPAT